MSTKEKVLKLLEENKNRALSGQTIAEHLGISRTAVWKAIQTLRQEGHRIESATKTGYLLLETADVLSASVIRSALPELEVRIFETIDSTNAEAKRILHEGINSDLLVIADEQTAGRGRLGRVFHSPEKTGLYMSLAMHHLPPTMDATLLTTAAAVAVCRAIEKLTRKKPKIKWVNDIFLEDRKICGILTEGIINLENQSIESVILGIGINLFLEESGIPPELQTIAGSLFKNRKEGERLTRNEIAAEIWKEFYQMMQTMETKEYLEDYRQRCFVLNRTVSFTRNKTCVEGKAVAIDDAGGLVIRLANGEETILSYGEISIKIGE